MTSDPTVVGHSRKRAQTNAKTALLHLAQNGDGDSMPKVTYNHGHVDNKRLLQAVHLPAASEVPLVGTQYHYPGRPGRARPIVNPEEAPVAGQPGFPDDGTFRLVFSSGQNLGK